MLFLRTFIARARPVISFCWYGVAVFGLSLLVLYGLLGIGLQPVWQLSPAPRG
ncbi:hypothetical protein [Acetobacter papayae]|uniref:hypothetical protein n=1 Tax=Acetobacter papayae TaxID=1076592 RepID=UPI000A5FECFB|nr:hypothetical protein [Acetobacter papayae]